MKKTIAFSKRNLLEMLRDPLIYIFCIAFPVILTAMFAVINSFTNGTTPVFEPVSLIPGIIIFSYTFVMLAGALLVSKDRTSALLIRLYTSPMKTYNFVIGYFVPLFLVGIAQLVVCIIAGAIVSAAVGTVYFTFGAACLLMVSSLPALITCISLGILFGTILNEKSAPGISSIFISAAGVLGGAWMPLDTMGGFETFCKFLPFYPSVYLGRVSVSACHSDGSLYSIGSGEWWVFVGIFAYLTISLTCALIAFSKKSKAE